LPKRQLTLDIQLFFWQAQDMKNSTQKTEASFLEISESHYSRILAGTRSLQATTVKKIAKKTSSDISVWFFGSKKQKRKIVQTAILKNNNINPNPIKRG